MRLFTRTRINKVRDGAKKKKVTKKKKFRAASSRCLLACIGLRPLVGDGVAKRDTPPQEAARPPPYWLRWPPCRFIEHHRFFPNPLCLVFRKKGNFEIFIFPRPQCNEKKEKLHRQRTKKTIKR